MSRDFRLFLEDILECCRNARSYIGELTFEEFAEDRKTIDAVVRNLEIIGEAVKNIPAEILERRPEIEWKQVARFRDIVIHRYFRIRLTVVWDILENQLTELEHAVESILSTLPKSED